MTTCIHVWGRLQDGEKGWQHRQNTLQRSAHELACLASLHRRPGSHYHSQDNPWGDKLICFTQSKWPVFSYSHWQMHPPPFIPQAVVWVFHKKMMKRRDLVVFNFTTGSLGKRSHLKCIVRYAHFSIYIQYHKAIEHLKIWNVRRAVLHGFTFANSHLQNLKSRPNLHP